MQPLVIKLYLDYQLILLFIYKLKQEKNMRFTLCNVEKVPLSYTNLFIGIIKTTVRSHQIRVDVYLRSNDHKHLIKIGAVNDIKRSMRSCYEFATKLLENEDFCTAHYMDYLNEEMKDD